MINKGKGSGIMIESLLLGNSQQVEPQPINCVAFVASRFKDRFISINVTNPLNMYILDSFGTPTYFDGAIDTTVDLVQYGCGMLKRGKNCSLSPLVRSPLTYVMSCGQSGIPMAIVS